MQIVPCIQLLDSLAPTDIATLCAAFADEGAPWIQLEDQSSETAGAPHKVQTILGCLDSVNIPIQYFGGVTSVHIGEMLLGLGVGRIVIGDTLWKSANSAEFMARKFGDRLVCRISPFEPEAAKDLLNWGAGAIQWEVNAQFADWDAVNQAGESAQLVFDPPIQPDFRNLLAAKGVKLGAMLLRSVQPADFGHFSAEVVG